MANHVSALKRARRPPEKPPSTAPTAPTSAPPSGALREALQKGDSTAAAAEFRTAVFCHRQSVQKGVIHANTASATRGRLKRAVKAIAGKPARQPKPTAKKSAAR